MRHEYGHTIQLAVLGPTRYLTCIGLPSWQKWGYDPYYDKPWEVTADILGGVEKRNPSQKKIKDGLEYFYNSCHYGILVWGTID